MKLILLLGLCCLAFHDGDGVPTARYMFVKCNPGDEAANCVTYQGPEIPWSPEQPSKLPAATANHLGAEPVEDEHPEREAGEEEANGKRLQPISDEGESPFYPDEYGSGYEGSAAAGGYYADQSFVSAASDAGSGERDAEPRRGEGRTSWTLADEAKPEEGDLKLDHLLQV